MPTVWVAVIRNLAYIWCSCALDQMFTLLVTVAVYKLQANITWFRNNQIDQNYERVCVRLGLVSHIAAPTDAMIQVQVEQ